MWPSSGPTTLLRPILRCTAELPKNLQAAAFSGARFARHAVDSHRFGIEVREAGGDLGDLRAEQGLAVAVTFAVWSAWGYRWSEAEAQQMAGWSLRHADSYLDAELGRSARGCVMAEIPLVHLLLEIELAGDEFADDDELELRYRLEEAIEARGIGEFGGSGSGVGGMDILVLVSDDKLGRAAANRPRPGRPPTQNLVSRY